MKKTKTLRIVSILFGFSWVYMFCLDWKFTLALLLAMTANNINQKYQ